MPLFIINVIFFVDTSDNVSPLEYNMSTVGNGVKQRRYNSPILFNIYMNYLNITLNSSGIGEYLSGGF